MDVLLVDGYNMIGDWPELKQLKTKDFAGARDRLVEKMAEYQGYSGMKVMIIFDAYASNGGATISQQYLVDVIFTNENETADERIEKMAGQLNDVRTQIYVATSDATEQWSIFGQGALRKSARELLSEVKNIEQKIALKIQMEAKEKPAGFAAIPEDVRKVFEQLRRGSD